MNRSKKAFLFIGFPILSFYIFLIIIFYTFISLILILPIIILGLSIIRRKNFGRMNYIYMNRSNLGPVRNDVNVVFDLGIHDISIMLFLVNEYPVSVNAVGRSFLDKDKCDVANIAFTFKSRTAVFIHLSWMEPRKIRQLTLVGDKNMLFWDDLQTDGPVKVFKKKIGKSEISYSDFGDFQLLLKTGGIKVPSIRMSEPLKNVMNEFTRRIHSSGDYHKDVIPASKLVRIAEAVNQSIKNRGKEIKIWK